jgi:hypothetical protein
MYGESLTDPRCLEEIEYYLGRWTRRIAEIRARENEIEDEN